MAKQIIITAKEANVISEQNISSFINSKTMKYIFNEIRHQASFGYKTCKVVIDKYELDLVIKLLEQFEYKTYIYNHRIDNNCTIIISW